MRKETVSIILLALRWSDDVNGFTIDSSINKVLSSYPKRARALAFKQKKNDVSVSDDDSDYKGGLSASSPLQDTDDLPINQGADVQVPAIELNTNLLIDDENDGGTAQLKNIVENIPPSVILGDSLESGKDNVIDDIAEKLVLEAISDLKPDIELKSDTSESSGTVSSKSAAELTQGFLGQGGSNSTTDLNYDFLENKSKEPTDATSESKSALDLTMNFLNNNEPKNTAEITREFLNGESKVVSNDEDTAAEMAANAVEAILKVSQEATEAAEATLPEEVAESVPLITVQNNMTNTIGMELPSLAVEGDAGKVVTSTEADTYPSVSKILLFAISATGVFLCNPLLSAIDTSAVGLLSGTAQQAALNPGVAVTDYAALLIAFLYTGATNLVAAAQEKDRGNDERPITTSSFKTALQLSGYVGFALGMTLFVSARPLLKLLIGNDSISVEIFSAAMKYVRIRALGMPAAAVIGSAQAGCLGMQDIRSPLYALVTAALVNLLGDTIFVGMKSSWFGGAAGAAWATVFSQYTAVYFFMRWLCSKPKPKKPKNVNISDAIMELTGGDNSHGKRRRRRFYEAIKSFGKGSPQNSSANSLASKVASVSRKKVTNANRFTTRGFLAGKFKSLDLLKLPKAEDAKEFAPFVIPVTTTQVGRVSGYVAMSHVVSSTLGTAAMAAQQVIVSLFYCLCPFADSLSLTAQSIVPSIVERAPSKGRAHALRKSMQNFYKASAVFGIAMVSAVTQIPFVSRFLTSDPAVAASVKSVAPYLIGFFSVHGLFMSSEGLLMAQKKLSFIGRMYACFFIAVPYFMLRVKKAALAGNSAIDLTSVWSVFIIYQFVRSVAFVTRTLQVQRHTDRAAEEAEAKLSS